MDTLNIICVIVGAVIGAVFIQAIQALSKPKTLKPLLYSEMLNATLNELNSELLIAMAKVDDAKANGAYALERVDSLQSRRTELIKERTEALLEESKAITF